MLMLRVADGAHATQALLRAMRIVYAHGVRGVGSPALHEIGVVVEHE